MRPDLPGEPDFCRLQGSAGIPHEVIVSGADEDVRESVPSKLVEKLSARKAREVFECLLGQGVSGDIVVIGADTVVACDGTILGKPENREDAARMLRMLSARVHHVYTGVTLCGTVGGEEREITFFEESAVHVAKLTQEEIRSYIDSGEPMDKAGAYGIQGSFMKHVTGIEGDYFNIVGLPVSHLYQALKRFIGQE